MTRDKHYSFDGSNEMNDPAINALRGAYASVPPPALREAMDAAVFERITQRPVTPVRRIPLPTVSLLPQTRRRALSLVAALAVVMTGLVSYAHLASPTPVSAQSVLHHAAAVHLVPNSAVHLTYSVAVTVAGEGNGAAPHTGRADVWIESNAAGTPVSSAQTLTLDVKNISSRYIQSGGQTYSYDPELRNDNTIAIGAETPFDPSWLVPNHVFDGAAVARYLNAPSQQQGVQLLPQQTLEGHTVDVVQVDGGAERPALRTTLYFDARTYLLRGFDATALDSSYPLPDWRARLTNNSTMPASAVPRNTFTLNSPPDARIDLPGPDSSGMAAAFQAICRTTLNLKAAMGSGRTPLDLCRDTSPDVTQARLVDALIAPTRHDLDQAFAGSQISQPQETDALAALKNQVTGFVTTVRPGK